MIHTPLGYIKETADVWQGWLEIAPASDVGAPQKWIAFKEGRTREQLMQRMLAEARFQMGLLGTMISWAENQEWARRRKK